MNPPRSPLSAPPAPSSSISTASAKRASTASRVETCRTTTTLGSPASASPTTSSGNGKTVLRGGDGIFYERVQGNDVYNAALNPPFAYIPSANNVYFSNPNTSALTGATTLNHLPVEPDQHQVQLSASGDRSTYSMGIQREVAPSIVAVLQYRGLQRLGPEQRPADQHSAFDRTPTTRPSPYDLRQGVATGKLNPNRYRIYPGFAAINQEENETNFNYNSLQAGVRVENRHGLDHPGGVHLGHNISIVSNDLNGLSNPFNPAYDRGSDTGFDRRQHPQRELHLCLPLVHQESEHCSSHDLGWLVDLGHHSRRIGHASRVDLHRHRTSSASRRHSNRPNLVSHRHISQDGTSMVQHQFVRRSRCSVEWRSQPGLRQCRQRCRRGAGNLQLESLPVQEHSASPATKEGPSIELRFESYNTFNQPIPRAWTPTATTGTSVMSPATMVPALCNWADSSDSELDSAGLRGATASCRALLFCRFHPRVAHPRAAR